MHSPVDDRRELVAPAPGHPLVAGLARAPALCNRVIVVLAALALILACLILSYSVLTRTLFHSATYWQDEAAVFLLGYGAFRFIAEYFREPDDYLGLLSLGMSMGQWLCVPMIVAGAALWIWSERTQPLPQKL